jgi:uncharacterized phage-associated protein
MQGPKLTRDDVVLATLAAASGDFHTPVQIQKLLFLVDRRLAAGTGGPHFNFEPYHYGPFDAQVYRSLEQLASAGLVEIMAQPHLRKKKYRASEAGMKRGMEVLKTLEDNVRQHLLELSTFVRKLGFAELVASIYREYPDMKANSVFNGQA